MFGETLAMLGETLAMLRDILYVVWRQWRRETNKAGAAPQHRVISLNSMTTIIRCNTTGLIVYFSNGMGTPSSHV